MKKDWFVVNERNMTAVAEMFKRDGFGLPSPRCFGRLISSFKLNLWTNTTLGRFSLQPHRSMGQRVGL